MSQAPIMPMATDAMIADTTHLTAEEFGAYHFILYATWRNNGVPLPDDDKRLARVCRLTVARWRRLRQVLEGFFDLNEGTWRQKRLEKEWDYVAQRRRALRANAAKGGRAKARKGQLHEVPEGSSAPMPEAATHTQTHTHTPTQEGEKTTPSCPPGVAPPGSSAPSGSLAPPVKPASRIRALGKEGDAVRPEEEAAWQDFWSAYPSRGRYANPRQPARQRFFALLRRGVPAAEMIGGAKAYGRDMASEAERRLVAQAQTFLKQCRWEQYADEGPSSDSRKGTADSSEDVARLALKAARWAERAPRWAALAKARARDGGRLPPYIKTDDLARLKAQGLISAETYAALAPD